jgi:hypothetical protein
MVGISIMEGVEIGNEIRVWAGRVESWIMFLTQRRGDAKNQYPQITPIFADSIFTMKTTKDTKNIYDAINRIYRIYRIKRLGGCHPPLQN